MRNSNFEVKVSLTLTQFKMLQEGAEMLTENFNKMHPKHGYVQSDKHFSMDQFLDYAIRDKYEEVCKENRLLQDFS